MTYNNSHSNSFLVHRGANSFRSFDMVAAGLYICDLSEQVGCSLSAVSDPRTSGLSARQVRRAQRVERLRQIMCASNSDMRLMAQGSVMPDANVTSDDLRLAERVFGPSLAGLKGRSTRPKSQAVAASIEPVPTDILKNNRDLSVAIDLMFINAIPFLVAYCKILKYGSLHHTANTQLPSLERCVREMNNVYRHRGFRVTDLMADNQFNCLRDCANSLGIRLTVVPSDAHVHEIERFIRLVKERARGIYNTTPF